MSDIRKFGLMGYPLEHSISPFIHRRLFELGGLGDCEYELYEVEPYDLSRKAGEIKELQGFNVTIPYKLEIIPYLDYLHDSAKRYGSVNCVKTSPDGVIGYNTDVFGFLKSIETLGASLNSKILLLGCGGVGRMFAIEAALAGAELTIAIRRDPAEEKAAARVSGEISELCSRTVKITYADRLNITNSYDLLLNATPCGMYPNIDETPLVPDLLNKIDYVFDAVYNPSPTKLVAEARKRGKNALDGLTMLVYQAAGAEEIWNSLRFEEDDLADIVEQAKCQL